MLSRFTPTGALEVYHALIKKYAPKRQHFAHPQMLARTELAALDHNSNVGRCQARVRKPNAQSTEEGDLKYHCAFSKQTKQWVAKPIHTEKKYDYIKPMMEAAIQQELSGEEGPKYTSAIANELTGARTKSQRTKSQRTKSQPLVLDVGVQTFLMYTCLHGSVPWFMYTYIHTYIHTITMQTKQHGARQHRRPSTQAMPSI